jgi:hypothetical protein
MQYNYPQQQQQAVQYSTGPLGPDIQPTQQVWSTGHGSDSKVYQQQLAAPDYYFNTTSQYPSDVSTGHAPVVINYGHVVAPFDPYAPPAAPVSPYAGYIAPADQYDGLVTVGHANVECYAHRQSMFLGVIMFLNGFICVAANVASLLLWHYHASLGYGIWSGAVFKVTGCLGMVASCKRTRHRINVFLTLNLTSISCCVAVIVLGIDDFLTFTCIYRNGYSTCFSKYCGILCEEFITSSIMGEVSRAMPLVMVATAGLQALLSTWGSIICIKATCSCCS